MANSAADDKYCRESLAVEYLSCLLKSSNPSAAAEIKSLFEEFEENKTPEAKFVNEIDCFECLVQAEEYEERATKDHGFNDFLSYESYISSKDLSLWTKLLAKERNAISEKRSTGSVIIFVIGKSKSFPLQIMTFLTPFRCARRWQKHTLFPACS